MSDVKQEIVKKGGANTLVDSLSTYFNGLKRVFNVANLAIIESA